jgi:hypothetical protein
MQACRDHIRNLAGSHSGRVDTDIAVPPSDLGHLSQHASGLAPYRASPAISPPMLRLRGSQMHYRHPLTAEQAPIQPSFVGRRAIDDDRRNTVLS